MAEASVAPKPKLINIMGKAQHTNVLLLANSDSHVMAESIVLPIFFIVPQAYKRF